MVTAASEDPDPVATGALTVDVGFACESATAPAADVIQGWVAAALEASGRRPARAIELAVRIVTAAEIRSLNARFRRQDKPTNVLAFPTETTGDVPDPLPAHLGDIVVCEEVVVAEAHDQRKAPADHWAHVLVHGTLHLVGFDHGNASEAAEMEALETQILAAGGVADPYAGR